MTCFSIQNSLRLVIAALFLALAAGPVHAQDAEMKRKMLESETQLRKERKADELNERFGKTESPIFLELFTTTDCSACVYADRMLYDASKDKNVIALSCRIQDMSEIKRWDEKDAMGDESNYDGPMDPCVFRQWTYKLGINERDITLSIPSFYFNGYDTVTSGDLTYFDNTLNLYHYAHKNKALEVFMQWKDDDTVTINLPTDPKIEKQSLNASVWLIRYKDMEVQRVDVGVNKGRVLRFSNIIQDIRHIAKWHGHMRSIDVDVPKPEGGRERGGYVVVVAEMMGEPVMAAGKLADYPTANDIKEKKAAAAAKAAAPSPSKPATQIPAEDLVSPKPGDVRQ